MKHLTEYISEAVKIVESTTEKTISFNFDGLENAEETLESLKDKEGCTVEDNKLTVKVNTDNVDKLGTVVDILQQYASKLRESTKSTNDEQYGQKTATFERNVGSLNNAIDEIKNPEEE